MKRMRLTRSPNRIVQKGPVTLAAPRPKQTDLFTDAELAETRYYLHAMMKKRTGEKR